MKAVVINQYGGPEVLTYRDDFPDPAPADDEIVIRIMATTVNPIDAVRRMGYGHKIFARRGGANMPLILGHDVSGVVIAKGKLVKGFSVGDEVWSAPDAFRNGTYAEQVTVRESEVDFKPHSLSHQEAASLPYVALTTWSALVGTGAIEPGKAHGKKVLVHAGSGGVGSFAIQLLKAWGAEVATTCSTGNVAFCKSLGADTVIDYTREKFEDVLKDYDVVFDTLGYLHEAEKPSLSVLKKKGGAHYVSIVHPILPWLDESGLPIGIMRVAGALIRRKLTQKLLYGRKFAWVHFAPDGKALATVRELVDAGLIKPQIHSVMPLTDVAKAHEMIESRRTRGKIVLEPV